METKWLDDFLCLAETLSFSRAAQLRHVTQPAFSRRIQSLEAWAGVTLIDRTAYPTRLTEAGEVLYEHASEFMHALNSTRNTLRVHSSSGQDVIDFAVPHTLAFTFFPSWLCGLQKSVGHIRSKLSALNVHDAIVRLTEGSSDLVVAYHHSSHPIQLDVSRYDMLVLGSEVLAPYCKPNSHGDAMFKITGASGSPIPFLGYSPGAYLGQVVDHILAGKSVPVNLVRRYETDMADGLKAMALEGHGLAFLPVGSVSRELEEHRLVSAGADWSATLEIRIFRQRPSTRKGKPIVNLLWNQLQADVLIPSACRSDPCDPPVNILAVESVLVSSHSHESMRRKYI